MTVGSDNCIVHCVSKVEGFLKLMWVVHLIATDLEMSKHHTKKKMGQYQ